MRTKNKPTLSAGEQALEALRVQNTMSKHAFYHAKGYHLEELADIWVKEDGPYAKTATFSQPQQIMHGMSVIKKLYGTDHLESQKKSLEAISKIYPEVKNIEENIGIGSEWAMHTQTTPIIEVAGDGKTAKGVWYSPGLGLGTNVRDGKVNISGTFFWEAYGADFAKEDGKWKLWHLQMYYDFTPALPASMTSMIGGGQSADKLTEAFERPQQAMPDGVTKNPVSYESWSPTSKPVMLPKFPEPYYTFSETFSY